MPYTYYPGCTLKNKASALEKGALSAASFLGVELREIPQWQCCGGVYPIASDEIAQKLPSVRALAYARQENTPLLTVCSACYHVLKSVNYNMKHNENASSVASSYLEYDVPYTGETNVVHYLEMLRDDVGFDVLKEKTVNPLNAKIAPYYGCMLLRPSEIMRFDDPENPVIMENFISSLGGEPVIYPFRNECCGGYCDLENHEIAEKNSRKVIESAKSRGADMIVTACPLCMYNLKKYSDIPVKYFTEVLCDALEIDADGDNW